MEDSQASNGVNINHVASEVQTYIRLAAYGFAVPWLHRTRVRFSMVAD
jgi:hypothetical protein